MLFRSHTTFLMFKLSERILGLNPDCNKKGRMNYAFMRLRLRDKGSEAWRQNIQAAVKSTYGVDLDLKTFQDRVMNSFFEDHNIGPPEGDGVQPGHHRQQPLGQENGQHLQPPSVPSVPTPGMNPGTLGPATSAWSHPMHMLPVHPVLQAKVIQGPTYPPHFLWSLAMMNNYNQHVLGQQVGGSEQLQSGIDQLQQSTSNY